LTKNLDKILLAMSGGVDSSVAVHILKERGFEVVGVTLWLSGDNKNAELARQAAETLDIEHIVVDARDEFDAKIIRPFVESYASGSTPNPCIICNPTLKWGTLIKLADKMSIEKVATGHYARISGSKILRAEDRKKDQAYFLYRLTDEQLQRTVLPIGEFHKDEVRKIAVELNLAAANRPESHEICFFERGMLREFLLNSGVRDQPGDIVDLEGNVIGRHDGWVAYTIGQRQGLGVASSTGRLYVVEINPGSHKITLGPRSMVMNREFTLTDALFHDKWPVGDERKLGIQIRHMGEELPGKITRTDESRAIVLLDRPAFAPAPGQSAVFFDGEEVAGGGIISKIED